MVDEDLQLRADQRRDAVVGLKTLITTAPVSEELRFPLRNVLWLLQENVLLPLQQEDTAALGDCGTVTEHPDEPPHGVHREPESSL